MYLLSDMATNCSTNCLTVVLMAIDVKIQPECTIEIAGNSPGGQICLCIRMHSHNYMWQMSLRRAVWANFVSEIRRRMKNG